jgi:4-hydroxy-tetrahydrodipicolinate synthase
MYMLNSKLTGTGVALITPFNADGSVDFVTLKQVVNHVIDGGVDYVVALGTTAETPTLCRVERDKVVKTILEGVNQRVPIIVGVGGNCTADCVETLKMFDFSGISGILSVVPYYNKPNQEGLFRHFSEIAKASPVPVILYNIPSRCGANMTADTTLRLANAYTNIIGVKEASGDMAQIKAIIQQKPDDFIVISGDDALAMDMIKAGGSGVISVLGNAMPTLISNLVKASLSGRYDEAQNLHNELQPLVALLFKEGSPTGIKAMMHILGLCENRLRLPLVASSESLFEEIRERIKN